MVVAVSGASLVGDPAGAFTQSFRQTQQFGVEQKQRELQLQKTQLDTQRQTRLQQLAAIAFGGQQAQQQGGAAQLLGAGQPQQPQPVSPQQAALTGQAPTLSRDDALQQLFALSPELGAQILTGIGAISAAQREDASRRAFEIRSAPPDQRAAIIQRQATELTRQGRNPKDTLGLLGLTPEEQDISLKTVELAALSAKERGTAALAQQKVTAAGVAAERRLTAPTTAQRDLIAEGLQPGTPEFQRALQEKRRKPVFERALGKLEAKDLQELREKAEKAEEELSQLDILGNIDVNTGALEPIKLGLASFVEGFGVNASAIANTAAGQSFVAESGKAVLRVLERQKGPQTDDDRRQIAKTIARLGNVPRANTFITDAARAFARRTVDERDFFDNFLAENNTLTGAARAWNLFKRNTPMVSKRVRTPEGLPVFFFKFRDRVKEANPQASEAEILQAWRDQEQAAK